MIEAKEVPKAVNPYAWPALVKCFKCNQLDYCSSDCPLRKPVHLTKREEEDDNEVYCELDGYGDDEEDYEGDDEGQNYVVRKLMLTPKQDENTQRH